MFKPKVADEALNPMNRDGLIMFGAIAACFTAMVTDSTHDGRKRVILHDQSPGIFKSSLASKIHVTGNILASRTLLSTRGSPVNKDGLGKLPAAGLVRQARCCRDGTYGDRDFPVNLFHLFPLTWVYLNLLQPVGIIPVTHCSTIPAFRHSGEANQHDTTSLTA
jgi:hypothetical protein